MHCFSGSVSQNSGVASKIEFGGGALKVQWWKNGPSFCRGTMSSESISSFPKHVKIKGVEALPFCSTLGNYDASIWEHSPEMLIFQGKRKTAKSSRLCPPTGSPSEGHNPPRGSPRKFASQRALRGSLRGSAGSPRGFCGVSAGLRGGPRDFPRFFGVVTLCL